MYRRAGSIILLVSLALVVLACAPSAAPTAAPTKAPAAAPTTAAATPTTAAAATKPAAGATTAPAATAAPPAAFTGAPTTVKFGLVESLGNLPVFIAMDKGYFKEQGINIELVPVQTTALAYPGMGTGELDFTAGALIPAQMNAVERGLPLKILTTLGRSKSGSDWIWWVLRKDLADSGQVKTAANLKGMKVGLTGKGSLSELALQLMLEKEGLKLDDVEEVVLSTTDSVAALSNKSLAAAYMIEPPIAQSIKSGIVTKWKPVSAFLGGAVEGGVVVAGKNLMENKDLGQRFMIAVVKGSRDYNKAFGPEKVGRADAVNTAVKYSALKDASLYDLIEMPYADPNGEVDMSAMKFAYDFYVKAAMYSGKLPVEAFIEPSYSNYAVQKLGRQ